MFREKTGRRSNYEFLISDCYALAKHSITAAPTEAAIAEHVGDDAGEAGIGANGGTEIVAAAAGLAIRLAAGLNGVQQGLEIRIIGRHTDRRAGMVES